MKALTNDERRAIARRIYEALRAQNPDRYVALFEQPADIGLPAVAPKSEIANPDH